MRNQSAFDEGVELQSLPLKIWQDHYGRHLCKHVHFPKGLGSGKFLLRENLGITESLKVT